MENMKILNSKEVKKHMKVLNSQFGVEGKLELVFLQNSKDKIYVVNRDIERVDLDKLRVTAIGMYFATIMPEGLRLSIEGAQIIGPLATKNVLELSDLKFEMWLKGIDFVADSDLRGFVLVKHGNDFVGCGKINKEGLLLNYVPKSRRLVVVNN